MPNPSPLTDTYSYSYDQLDRLAQGVMGSGQGRETLTYDRMGNIESLIRTGTSSTVVDELDYSYIGNRLMGVTDAVVEGTISDPYHLGGSTVYTYDDNGNLKSRVNAGNTGNNMTDVIYNHLNLPSSLTATWATVSYTYDALGRKLQSINGTLGQTREYISGIEYENGSIEMIHHSEGRIVRSGGSYLFEYYLKDHLGNNRSGFGAGTNVTQPNFSADYYPFGMQYWQYIRLGNPKNNYLYNGKELQDGLQFYDYGARLYDPVIGRWGTMDPLAEQYSNVSPYNYALNNPIKFIDPDGRSVAISDPREIENLVFQAKMSVAMGNGEDDEDGDDPKKKKTTNNNTEIRAAENISTEERARRERMYLDRERQKSVNYQDMSQPTTSLATIRGVVEGFAGEYAVIKAAPVLKKLFVAKTVTNSVTRSESVLGHIFRDATGHVNPGTVTSQNNFIRLFEGVGNNSANLNPIVLTNFQRTAGGFQGYSQIFRNGKQVWVQTLDGKIINAGVNIVPK